MPSARAALIAWSVFDLLIVAGVVITALSGVPPIYVYLWLPAVVLAGNATGMALVTWLADRGERDA